MIVEDSVDEKMKHFLVAQNGIEQNRSHPISITSKEFVTDNIDEGILIFNATGYLVQMNRAAESYYHGFGYLDDILGMHYDNLSLDMSTFEQLNYLRSRNGGAGSMEKEIKFGNLYFEMKYIFDEVEGTVIVIIHEVTEVRKKKQRSVIKLS